MDLAPTSQQERAEVERILQSGIFDKAPRLGRFFRYICDRHFDGQADRLKEYSIAVEALGRNPDFDPKKDSIVRVEAHRLRKRLDIYYLAEGADHAVRIIIPNGQYRPQFVSKEEPIPPPEDSPLPELTVLHEPEIEATVAPPPAAPKIRPRWPLVLSTATVLVAVALLSGVKWFGWLPSTRGTPISAAKLSPATQNEVWAAGGDHTPAAEVRLLSGYHGPLYMDRQGHAWQADAFYTGGRSQSIAADRPIDGEADNRVLRTFRSGHFRYDIPLLPGTHELRLYFVESEFGRGTGGGEGSRTINLGINGQRVLALFDPVAEAGAPYRVHVRVFKDITPASDGKLHLNFEPAGVAPAILSAIEILPSAAGRIHPVRIVMQMQTITDSDGRVWAADEFYSGGTVVWRDNVLIHGEERALYQGERYGNFTYRIPVAPGKYRLTLHFAEQWFGTDQSGRMPINNRIFNVFANGVALLRDFCLGTEAHGPNRAFVKSFENLEPNAQGELRLEFVPVKNYAELNALEVIETQ